MEAEKKFDFKGFCKLVEFAQVQRSQ
jgi:hypothetical protein